MATYKKQDTDWMLTDEESVLLEEDEDTGLILYSEFTEYTDVTRTFSINSTSSVEYDAYTIAFNWILDDNNNVILSDADSITGVCAVKKEPLECNVLAPAYFLLDNNDNVLLRTDTSGIMFNYMELCKLGFAVYNSSDSILTFYGDTSIPSSGDTYDGKTATTVYTDFCSSTYTSASSVPWYSNRSNIKEVYFHASFRDIEITSTAYWFYGFSNCTEFHIDNINTSNAKSMQYMFYNCTSLESLSLLEMNTSKATSYSNFAINCNNLTEIKIGKDFDLFTKSSSALISVQYWHDENDNNLNDYLIGVSGEMTCTEGIAPSSFAVYCSSDNSLSFYYDVIPQAGDTYNSKTVTSVYEGFETETYSSASEVQWYSDGTYSNVVSVYFDNSFSNVLPVSTSYWFNDFTKCTSFDGVINLNTSKATSMAYMFAQCSSITFIYTSTFDTSNVRSMERMFYLCSELTSLDMSSWNTSKVTNMYGMFNGCSSITTLDLSSFTTFNVTEFDDFATGCTDLSGITITTNFDLFIKTETHLVDQQYWHDANGTNLNDYLVGVFDNVSCYVGISYVEGFAVYSDDDGSLTFYSDAVPPTEGGTYHNKTVTNIYTNVADTGDDKPEWQYDFDIDVKLVSFDESFAVIQPKSTAYWFYFYSECTSIDLTYLDTSEVTNMSYMFYYCLALTSLDVSRFNTSKVSNMSGMFGHCTNVASLDVTSFDTSNVTDMENTFAYCSALTELNLSYFNTSNVINTAAMFLFSNKIVTIYANDIYFDTSNVENSTEMFWYTSSIVGGNGTTYDSSKINKSMAHVDTASNPGYFTKK